MNIAGNIRKKNIPEAAPVTSATPGNNVMVSCFTNENRKKKEDPGNDRTRYRNKKIRKYFCKCLEG